MLDKIKLFFLDIYNKVKGYIERVILLINSIKLIEQIKNISINFLIKINKFLMVLFFMALILILFLISGCSAGASVRYYPVSVPVKCNIDMPDKPVFSENILETNMNITKYAEELEAGLQMCRGAD